MVEYVNHLFKWTSETQYIGQIITVVAESPKGLFHTASCSYE